VGPGGLREIICNLHPSKNASRLVGFELADDAGVYLLGDVALIQTIDVITPIVDDPALFGRIAAANSLSDVYAMGGRPITALNFIAYPDRNLPARVVGKILEGGMDACEEAGCQLMGGHTIKDDEVKYGLAVTGVAKPEDIVTNTGARAGDVLVLTKPLGTGIISTAVKAGAAKPRSAEAAASSMATLNSGACEAMMTVGAHACTDVTGFGLMGHAAQLARASRVTLTIEATKVPLLPGVLALARKKMAPGGTKTNLAAYKKAVRISPDLDTAMVDVLFDAQTSGGLLIAVEADKASKLVTELKKRKTPVARIIGRANKMVRGVDVIIE